MTASPLWVLSSLFLKWRYNRNLGELFWWENVNDVSDLSGCQPQMGVLDHRPSPKAQGLFRRRGQKDCKRQKKLERTGVKHYLMDMEWPLHPRTHGNCGWLRSSYPALQHEGGRGSPASAPTRGVVESGRLLGVQELVFIRGMVPIR